MMYYRTFWIEAIEKAWKKRSIVWLMGVRRVGKTSLCKSLPDVQYFDCEMATTRDLLKNYELFLAEHKGKRIILDEIHMLDNPSEILKVAADHFPEVKIIATGSSTLGASKKFSDTLAGRKREVWLTPMLLDEMLLFENNSIDHRFLFGGFPALFCEEQIPAYDFKEWTNAYWAKDIQELFLIAKRNSFQKFTQLLMINSGGMFEATKYATFCEISRETIMNYLKILEETFVVHIIRPYSMHKSTEIVKAPKIYGFDTGFVCYAKGWLHIRPEDRGFMWEHLVLNEIQGRLQTQAIFYWRDKNDNEIDFVIQKRTTQELIAIECKFTIASDEISLTSISKNFESFRALYPNGQNIVVAYNIDRSYTRVYKNMTIHFVSAKTLIEMLAE